MTEANTALKQDNVVRVKRLPRYTSYPTALEFDVLDGQTYDNWLKALPPSDPVSLYFHIPYCDRLCWFCGCYTTISNKYDPVKSFLNVLMEEIRQTSNKTGRLKVSHIHFGGGSPSILEPSDFIKLIDVVQECYDIENVNEFAVEIDPRTVDRDKIEAYAKAGVNRVSLGIQDFNEKTQRAINRIQSVKLVEDTVQHFKDVGINRINFDLIYGLPYQTFETIKETIDQTLKFKPTRIALFGYAHVPHIKKHQKLIENHSLPAQKERQSQFELASTLLQSGGYRSIGLDHFSLPEDHLFVSFDQRKLKRNFQGYTEDKADTLIGFGPSAISNTPSGYAQNIPMINQYKEKVEAGHTSVVRGLAIDEMDKMVREVISTLMCYFEVDPGKIASAYTTQYDFHDEIESLNKLVQAGYMEKKDTIYQITKSGEPFLRAIATIFDQNFNQETDIIDRCIHESEG